MIYLKLAFRKLSNPKENNLIKIFSLGVGFAVALVLFAKINFDFSYNSFYPESDQIYTIFTHSMRGEEIRPYPQVSGAIALGMKTEIPEVEAATRFTYFASGTFYNNKDRSKYKGTFILADSCLFDLLPRPMIAGNAKETLSRPMYALVAKSIADNMGGNVIGQQIEIDNRPGKSLTIGGVFEDIPKNAHHRYDIIVSMSSISQFTRDGSNNWIGNDRYIGYVKLKKGTDPTSLTNAFRQMQVKYQDIEKLKAEYNSDWTYNLNKLNDAISYYPEVKRNILLLVLLGATLLFATIMNYMLFVISGLVDKSKNAAIHKTYGATTGDISKMMISDTFVHFFFALILAGILIFACRKIIEGMFYADIVSLFTFKTSVFLILAMAIIFIGTTVIPSRMLSSTPVITVISSFRKNRKGWKLALLFVQFTASAFLITLLAIVILQYDKMVNEDHGFEYENLVYVTSNNPKNNIVIEEIKQLPFVEAVAKGSDLPIATGYPSGNNVSIPEEKTELFNIADFYWVDENFIPTMNIEIIEGTNFTSHSAKDEILVSKTFDEKMRSSGWQDGVVGKYIQISEHGLCKIIGVYKDFAIAAFTNSLRKPSAIFYDPNMAYSIVIKLKDVNGENIVQIQKAFGNVIPEKDIEIVPYSTSFISHYDTENKFKDSVMTVGLIILIINMVGLIAYINNEVQRRKSEIAVRKVNGATLIDVLSLFIKDILWLAIPALAIGAIVAYYIALKWMEEFVVKIPMSPMLFIGCCFALLLLIQSLVAIICMKIANQNPIDSIKSE